MLPRGSLRQAALACLLSSAALRILFEFPLMPLLGRASYECAQFVLHPRSVWPMKHSMNNMRSVRGSAALTIIIAVVILGAIAAGAWWYLNRSEGAAISPPVTSTPSPSTPESETVAPVVSAAVEGLSIDQLYREARKAMAEQRMVAPAGNNALEFYLAILETDPTNAGANDALRELFPFASGTAEQEINQGNLEEATRIIDSLAKADPSNYTLTILRSKMEVKRRQEEQLQTQAAAAAAAAAAPATAPRTPESETGATPVPASAAAKTPVPTPAPAPSPAPVQAPPTPATPQGETRDVEVIAPAAPSYPTKAARNREEGWVEVEFTVTADGNVVNASVAASNPPRTFDREAVRSIQETKFRPRLENGVPVDSTVRRRIEFKLNR